jgi:trimeric autotransporter adhesin
VKSSLVVDHAGEGFSKLSWRKAATMKHLASHSQFREVRPSKNGDQYFALGGAFARAFPFPVLLIASSLLAAKSYTATFNSTQSGQVLVNGLPVPGVTIIAVQVDKKLMAVTDLQGQYIFPDLSDGAWTLTTEMTGFCPITRQVTAHSSAPTEKWELQLLAIDQIKRLVPMGTRVSTLPPPPKSDEPLSKNAPRPPPKPAKIEEETAPTTDGLLINGSTNNGAASPFAQFPAFGNSRTSRPGLYNGGIGLIGDTSLFDARSFSLTGQDMPRPSYTRLTAIATLGGPIRFPHVKQPPYFFIGYQWTRNNSVNTATGLMPTLAERNNPRTTPGALALLSFYPLPNFTGSSRYNYQIPLVDSTHQDALQSRLNKSITRRDDLFGRFALQDQRSSTPNLFNFLDTSGSLGLSANTNWFHRFGIRLNTNLNYQFTRLSTRNTPYFENRGNVSGLAGISGNDQSPVSYGPPSLSFASGITGLADGLAASNHNQTSAISDSTDWYHGRHNVTFGGEFRRQQFNYLSQQNPRGSFSFTGAATGNDFSDFLLGIPDTAALAFGNDDKYFRESVYDAYVSDDWRLRPELTINVGLRWEYSSPISELYGRLVNLNVSPAFSTATPVVGNNSIHPDKRGVEPRVAIAWRPLSGSSLVVRTGYGVYYNTSVYQNIATQMAQQAPLSKSLNIANSVATPLTLANAFNTIPNTTTDTFAIDPNFRIGYAQAWQVSVQRDLPASLQMTATYNGIKGTRGMQEFLPNSVPTGAFNPCPRCPLGFVYLTSNGNSSRESAQFQLRRRLRSGVTSTLQYTFAKALDDDSALGGQGFNPTQSASASGTSSAALLPPVAAGSSNATLAQNWLDLSAERSRSSFDQRHLLSAQIQYTSGMGLKGGALLSGWRATLLNEWTVATLITAGSGLPETPFLPTPVNGTGFTGSLRPDYTGSPLYAAPSGLVLNPAAFTTPLPGQWGNVGRNIIAGPTQFTLNASMGRGFRLSDRLNLDLRLDSANALNHVTFASWNTLIGSAQFGLPTSANGMRSIQTTLRLRF